jgi:hypothetical protein
MSYLLLAPDPTFTGVCSGVAFENGVGVCESDFLAGWLCAKGFTIPPGAGHTDEPKELPPDIPDDLDALGITELVALARTHGISLAGVRTGDKDAICARIRSLRE